VPVDSAICQLECFKAIAASAVLWLLLLLLLLLAGTCKCKSWLGMLPKYIQNPDPAQRHITPMVPACR
jgi:hypothetical protein